MLLENKQPLGSQTVVTARRCLGEIGEKRPTRHSSGSETGPVTRFGADVKHGVDIEDGCFSF